MATKRIKANSGPAIASLWQSIASWLITQHQESLDLPQGATEGELSLAEAALGVKFPRDLRESYSIHNGTGSATLIPFGQWGYPLLSLSGMIGQWKLVQSAVQRGVFTGPDFVNNPRGPIKKVWFHAKWIPILDNQCGDFYFVDLAPAKGGKPGQIIDFSRENGAVNVLADSFLEFLVNVTAQLKAGKYKYDEKNRTIVRSKKA